MVVVYNVSMPESTYPMVLSVLCSGFRDFGVECLGLRFQARLDPKGAKPTNDEI